MAIFPELDETSYYIFREGMTIRKKVARELFIKEPLNEFYPSLIYEDSSGGLKGTGILQALYNAEGFKPYYPLDLLYHASPELHNQFLAGEKPNIKNLDHKCKRIALAIKTGILKYDSRGYYFSPSAKELHL